MNTTLKRAAAGLVALTSVLVWSVGCSSNEYHYYYWSTLSRAPDTQDMQTMIDTCQITPTELVMADLKGDYLARRLRNKTCGAIHRLLGVYHRSGNFEPTAMWNNPALSTNPPTLGAIKYAIRATSKLNTEQFHVFVDFTQDTVLYGLGDLAISEPAHWGTTKTITAQDSENLQAALTPLLSWGAPWTQPWQDVVATNENLSIWRIAIITDDDRLYRWEYDPTWPQDTPPPDTMFPAGLPQIYAAFQALVPQ